MATSVEFTEYVLDLLSSLGPIQTTRMFSGVLLKVGGEQLGVILMETLYFKVVDVDLQIKFKSLGSEQFEYSRKDKPEPVIIKNWWSVPDELLESGAELTNLAEEVLDQTAHKES